MNTFCLLLVLFETILIVYARGKSSAKTASAGDHSSKNEDRLKRAGIFEEFPAAELVNPSGDVAPVGLRMNFGKIQSPKDAQTGKQSPGQIFDDYDVNVLKPKQYNVMLGPKKFKQVKASLTRFLNKTSNSLNDSAPTGQKVIPPNGNPVLQQNSKLGSNPSYLRGSDFTSTVAPPNLNTSQAVEPPPCDKENKPKYQFSADFSKKPTVQPLTTENGPAASSQTPNIAIGDNLVTMSTGNATGTTNNMPSTNSPFQFTHIPENTPPEGLEAFTITPQNTIYPQNQADIAKVANENSIKFSKGSESNIQPYNNSKTPTRQQTLQIMQNIQNQLPMKVPLTNVGVQPLSPLQGMEKVNQNVPLMPSQQPAGIVLNSPAQKPLEPINNIIRSELSGRSFFGPETNEYFKKPTGEKVAGSNKSDILYDLLKNITITNVENENLNKKLLDESQIHTKQNSQLIKDSSDIINILKNKTEKIGTS